MDMFFISAAVFFTACIFYTLGGSRALAKKRRASKKSCCGQPDKSDMPSDTAALNTHTMRNDATRSLDDKTDGAFYCSAIAEGYANMATGGAFAKSRKRGEGLR